MSTTDGTIDQKLFHDMEWIYHCLLPKTAMQMKDLQSTKVYLSLSAQMKQQNGYSSIINSLTLWIVPSFCQKSEFVQITNKQL